MSVWRSNFTHSYSNNGIYYSNYRRAPNTFTSEKNDLGVLQLACAKAPDTFSSPGVV
jgi:hypothetical protein